VSPVAIYVLNTGKLIAAAFGTDVSLFRGGPNRYVDDRFSIDDPLSASGTDIRRRLKGKLAGIAALMPLAVDILQRWGYEWFIPITTRYLNHPAARPNRIAAVRGLT